MILWEILVPEGHPRLDDFLAECLKRAGGYTRQAVCYGGWTEGFDASVGYFEPVRVVCEEWVLNRLVDSAKSLLFQKRIMFWAVSEKARVV